MELEESGQETTEEGEYRRSRLPGASGAAGERE